MNEYVWMNEWYFRPRFCAVRLYWAEDNLRQWQEFWYEPCSSCRISRSTCWPAVQRATTVTRTVTWTFCYCLDNTIIIGQNLLYILFFLDRIDRNIWRKIGGKPSTLCQNMPCKNIAVVDKNVGPYCSKYLALSDRLSPTSAEYKSHNSPNYISLPSPNPIAFLSANTLDAGGTLC